jgi:hypothetical protein
MSVAQRVARLEAPWPGGCRPAWVRALVTTLAVAAALAAATGVAAMAVVPETTAVLAAARGIVARR